MRQALCRMRETQREEDRSSPSSAGGRAGGGGAGERVAGSGEGAAGPARAGPEPSEGHPTQPEGQGSSPETGAPQAGPGRASWGFPRHAGHPPPPGFRHGCEPRGRDNAPLAKCWQVYNNSSNCAFMCRFLGICVLFYNKITFFKICFFLT